MCNMHNIYRYDTQSEAILSTAAPVVWNAFVTNLEYPTVPPACLLVAYSPSTLHADKLGVFHKPIDTATPNTAGLPSFNL